MANVDNSFDPAGSGTDNVFRLRGTMDITGSVIRTQKLIIPIGGNAKVGATSGWVITGGTDFYHATLPASQTDSTLIVPITGLHIGDTLTGVSVTGQIESAGNNVTLSIGTTRQTTAASGNVVVNIGATSLGPVTADTLVSSANLAPAVVATTMVEGRTIFVLLTGTTAVDTDIDVTGLIATVIRV